MLGRELYDSRLKKGGVSLRDEQVETTGGLQLDIKERGRIEHCQEVNREVGTVERSPSRAQSSSCCLAVANDAAVLASLV